MYWAVGKVVNDWNNSIRDITSVSTSNSTKSDTTKNISLGEKIIGKDVEISINNGTFRPGIPFRKIDITDKNLFVIYDNNDKNIQNMTIQNIIKKLCEKFLQKGFDNLDYKKVQGFALYNTNKWETIELFYNLN